MYTAVHTVDTKHGLTDIADQLLEIMPGGLLRVSSTGTILVANQRARQHLELGPQGSERWQLAVAMEGALLEDGTPCPIDRLPASVCLATGVATGPTTIGIPGGEGAGDIRWALWSASPARDPDGPAMGAVVSFEDVTRQVDTDRRLRESESRIRALVDAAFEGLCISVDGRIVDCNGALADLFGYRVDELIGTSVFDLATPDMRAMVMDRVQSGSTEPYLAEGLRKDGKRIICELLGCNALYQGQRARITAVRDVTERERLAADLRSKEEERQRLEERIRKIQNLESLGVLAGGIAHEFNNLLMGIMGYAELGTRQVPVKSTARECLEMVLRSARRASELTQQMLAYAGRARLEIGPVSLSEMAARTVESGAPHAAGPDPGPGGAGGGPAPGGGRQRAARAGGLQPHHQRLGGDRRSAGGDPGVDQDGVPGSHGTGPALRLRGAGDRTVRVSGGGRHRQRDGRRDQAQAVRAVLLHQVQRARDGPAGGVRHRPRPPGAPSRSAARRARAAASRCTWRRPIARPVDAPPAARRAAG
jgi:PAS domain S-box-containing protein